MKIKTLITGVAAVFAVVGLTVSAHAETNTYTQTTNNLSWATGGNWSLGVPTSDQDVFVNNAVTARIPGVTAAVAKSVTIGGANGTSALHVRGADGLFASLTVGGNITLAPGAGSATLQIQFPDSALTLNGGSGSIVRGDGAGVADLVVADWSGSLGLATATVDNLNLAQTGATTLTITSDQTYNVSNLVRVNNSGAGVDSVLNINGGMLNLGNSTPSTTANGRLWFNSGTAAGNNTTVNLNNGGTLIAIDILRANTGSAVLNFNDGKIATRSDANLNIRSTSSAGPMEIALAETGTHTFEAAEGRSITVQSTALLKDKTGEAGTLTKTGAGTLRIDSASTYTGATTINAGSLVLGAAGSIGSSSVLSVASGATLNVSAVTNGFVVGGSQALRGSGTIVGNTTVTGILAPGDGGIGTLAVANNLTWNSGNSWLFELGTAGASLASPGTSDLLDITAGDFLKGDGPSWTFDFVGTGAQGWYKLVTWTGTTGFSAGDFTATGLSGANTGTFVIDGDALYIQIVPEPSTVALLAMAAGGLALAIRRKKLGTGVDFDGMRR
jgi:autotransporter-associated beta strand protein